jgi:tRNA threonylcarbamoyladenosine biosynthesis protein TsaB
MGLRSYRKVRRHRPHRFLPEEGPLVAAIDATSESLGVAAARAGVFMGRRQIISGQPRGTAISQVLNGLLSDIGASASDLSGIIVTRGPGSFTGVRLGLMAAKTLAWALEIPLVAVDTLEVLAAAVHGEACVAVDARKGEVYFARYLWQEQRPCLESPPDALTPESAADRIKSYQSANPGVTLVGTGFSVYPELRALRHGGEDPGVPDPRLADFPDPAILLRLGLGRLDAGELSDPDSLEPLYVRDFQVTPPKDMQ